MMKVFSVSYKNSLVFFFVISLFVFTAGAQKTGKPDREVKGRVLTSKNTPQIRLKFGKMFKFAGSQDFVLYDRAKAEQYFFVEAENKKIKRLFMIQFESFLPGTDGKYDYNESQTLDIGGS